MISNHILEYIHLKNVLPNLPASQNFFQRQVHLVVVNGHYKTKNWNFRQAEQNLQDFEVKLKDFFHISPVAALSEKI